MSKDGIGPEPENVSCPKCNLLQNCDILSSVQKSWAGHGGTYSILECRGCNQVFYRTVSWDENDVDFWYDESGAPVGELNYSESIFPVGLKVPSKISKGGNPGKFDWAQAVGSVVFGWADNGTWQPKSQGEVRAKLADWFDQQGQTPDDKLLKDYARWLFGEFRQRASQSE